MKIVCVSDTHHRYGDKWGLITPPGDILVHAGDATMSGKQEEILAFNSWLGKQPQKIKLFVPGNHDWLFEKDLNFAKSLLNNAITLVDQPYNIEGIKFYGSPWQPAFCNWAFNLPRGGKELERKWSRIPDDTDFLITHGPPFGHGDKVPRFGPDRYGGETSYPTGYDNVGCGLLRNRVDALNLKWHVFGHIHSAAGYIGKDKNTTYINASICDFQYIHNNPGVVIDTESREVKSIPCHA